MSISSEISRISQNVSDSLNAVAAKGVAVPAGSKSDDLPGLIAQIPTGENVLVQEVPNATGVEYRITTNSGVNLLSPTYYEYIQGIPRQQMIDTGICIENISDLKIEWKYRLTNLGSTYVDYVPIWGDWVDDNKQSTRMILHTASYVDKRYYVNCQVKSSTSVNDIAVNTDHVCSMTYNSVVIDGTATTLSHTTVGNANTNTLKFFSNGSASTSDGYPNYRVRIYYFRIYSGDTLLHDYLPAMVDEQIGMYDIKTNTFLPNIGTGSFTVGDQSEKQVYFIDYDGTILHSYTAEEANALTTLPANPSHLDLTAQGWNWTLAQIKTHLLAVPNAPIWVGQMYTTINGDSEIYITIDGNHLEPYLIMAVNGTVTVNWGDNTSATTVTGTSLTSLKYSKHTYASAGSYKITIHVTSGSFSFYNDASGRAGVLTAYGSSSNRRYNREYSRCVTKIRIGTGITTIGNYAFANCYNVETITIPNTVTNINIGAIRVCYALKSLTIPSNVTSLSESIVYGDHALKNISIPSGITTIGPSAFYNCYMLQSITIPNGIASIGDSTFYGCYAMKNVVLPNTVRTIGASAFYNCAALESITMPTAVTSIGDSAFYYCYELRSIAIPSTVTSIGASTFYNCAALESMIIPSTVTSIGNAAFRVCYGLKSLTIPSSVTSIGTNAFYNCFAIAEYHFKMETPPTLGGTNAFNGIVSGTKIYVPYSADHSILNAYKAATNWASFTSYLAEEPQ